MNRRQLLGYGVLTSVAVLGGGVALLPRPGVPLRPSLTEAMALLQRLQGMALESRAGWSVAEVFNHCAQSVEFSLDGYPQLKPAWFRHSIGPAALALFQARGGMRHALDEPIPGAPSLDAPLSAEAALARLQQAFARFSAHGGALAPHFAYGELTHAEYAQAHALHLYEHLSLIRPSGDHAVALSADIQSRPL